MCVCTTGYYHLSSGIYVLFFNMNAQEQMLTIKVSPHGASMIGQQKKDHFYMDQAESEMM